MYRLFIKILDSGFGYDILSPEFLFQVRKVLYTFYYAIPNSPLFLTINTKNKFFRFFNFNGRQLYGSISTRYSLVINVRNDEFVL